MFGLICWNNSLLFYCFMIIYSRHANLARIYTNSSKYNRQNNDYLSDQALVYFINPLSVHFISYNKRTKPSTKCGHKISPNIESLKLLFSRQNIVSSPPNIHWRKYSKRVIIIINLKINHNNNNRYSKSIPYQLNKYWQLVAIICIVFSPPLSPSHLLSSIQLCVLFYFNLHWSNLFHV